MRRFSVSEVGILAFACLRASERVGEEAEFLQCTIGASTLVSLSELGNDAYPQKTRKSLHVFTSYISYF